jgi:hypothetical protein
MDFAAVRKLALALPEVKESTAYGSPAFKARGKMLACIAINKSAEPGSLVVMIDLEQRAALLAESPDVYYLTGHYAPYPCVLVRLSKVHKDAMRDLLGGAWRFVTTKSAPKKSVRKKAPRKK